MNREQRRAADAAAKRLAKAGAVDLAQRVATESQPVAKVYLAWMYNNEYAKPSGAWVQSLLSCFARGAELGYALRPVAAETGPQLDKARNLLLKDFLAGDPSFGHILFTDTDTVFTPDDVKQLLDVRASIAGALYFTAATGEASRPVPLRRNDDGDYVPIVLPEPPADLEQAPETAQRAWVAAALVPQEVAAVGMGLTLISREAAQAVVDKYDWPFEYADGRSEDLNFCLRAAELGHPTTLVPTARIGHLKTTVL